MKIQSINLYTNKKQSFKQTAGMTAGSGNNFNDSEKRPQPKFDFVDMAYWMIIANTLAINPVITKNYIEDKTAKLNKYNQDKNTQTAYEQMRKDIKEKTKTSNALYHLSLFNSTELPEIKKLDDSLYYAKFNTGDKNVSVTFSTKDLDKNIISGEITTKTDDNLDEIYTYKMDLDTLGSKTFDIELQSINDSSSIKQTYERDNYGSLYYIDKENNKKIPVNEYTLAKSKEKNEIEKSIDAANTVYQETQKLNYMICIIATFFQMLRHSPRKNEEEE